jgi:hypothetical protein
MSGRARGESIRGGVFVTGTTAQRGSGVVRRRLPRVMDCALRSRGARQGQRAESVAVITGPIGERPEGSIQSR